MNGTGVSPRVRPTTDYRRTVLHMCVRECVLYTFHTSLASSNNCGSISIRNVVVVVVVRRRQS